MTTRTHESGLYGLVYRRLERMGMAGELIRWGMHAAAIVLMLATVLGVSRVYFILFPNTLGASSIMGQGIIAPYEQNGGMQQLAPTQAPPPPDLPAFDPGARAQETAIRRQPVFRTNFPTRPRYAILPYVVQPGDTLISIAGKFTLKPSTILWGNPDVLRDDPHNLRPGQELTILPADGAIYVWHSGDSLQGVADFFSVTPQTILNWPGNMPAPEGASAAVEADIPSGAGLFIPGGRRDFVTWKMPRVTRLKPGEGQVLGSGFCEKVETGPTGSAAFDFPVQDHFLSGYDFLPEANHYGIDLAGRQGEPVHAADDGVVIYAGWNNWGYGNLVVIDHGNGWQSIYAHLDEIRLACGQPVTKRDILGMLGASGNTDHPNLHFELMNDEYGRVNPWNFLP